MKIQHTVLNLLFSGLLVLPAGLLAAEDAENSNRSNKASNIEAEYELAAYYLSDDSFRFGKYSGVTDEGWEPVLNFRIQSRPEWDAEDPSSWQVQGWRLGLDSMRLKFDYNDQGRQRFTADYREIPNYRFSDGMSPFNGIGSGQLTLPANWVGPANGGTDTFAALQQNLKPVRSSWERQRLDLDFSRAINRQWSFNVDWRHETKDGLGTFGGVIGNSGGNPRSVVLPAPVDWETDIMEASFDFANSRYQFGFSLYASWFDNAQTSVTWDNPFGQRSGWAAGVGYPDGQGLYSLAPNNEAMQFRVYGGMNFSGTSRLSADVSIGTMEQDDPLFAYSVNPALAIHTPLPRTRMDAQIDTTHANIRYTARPLDRLNVLASYTLDDRDNKTPRDEWIYIGGDSQNQKDPEDARINLPYSYEKEQWDLSATWRATRGVRIRGGLEFKDYTRTYSEVLGSDESRAFVGFSLRKWEKSSLSFDYSSSERDVDAYQGNRTFLLSHLPGAVGNDEFENLPALRKFNQTDRDRDEYRFRADFFPTSQFNFALMGSWSEDDYDDPEGLFGLRNSEVTMWSVDMGIYPRDGVSLTAYYTMENYDSVQASRSWRGSSLATADDPGNNWFANSEDDVDTWNVALTFERPGEVSKGGMEFGMDYTHSRVDSDIVVTGAANINTAPLPALVSKMRSWSIFGTYEINMNSSLRLAFEQQKLTTRDFALDNVPLDGPTNVLLLGRSSPNYDLSLLMLSYIYRHK